MSESDDDGTIVYAPCGDDKLSIPSNREMLDKLKAAFGVELSGAVLLFTKPCSTGRDAVHLMTVEVVLVPKHVPKMDEVKFEYWARQTMGLETLQNLQAEQQKARGVENARSFVQAPAKGRH